MSMHTPGPWQVEKAAATTGFVVCPPRGAAIPVIAMVYCYHAEPDGGYAQANARLIAAAPALLAACHRFARMCELHPDRVWMESDIYEQANSAIAQAEGRQS
jgi:hypothetical protein